VNDSASATQSFESQMGGPSHEVIALATAYARTEAAGIRVADLGCGDGRNSFLLAGVGCSVTSIDNSAQSIGRLRQLAAVHSLPIEAQLCDVRDLRLHGQYDSILAHGIVHFLEQSAATQLISEIKQATKPGGYNVYTVVPFQNLDDIPSDMQAAGYKGSLASNDVMSHYRDWEIISAELYRKWDWHPGVGIHDHPIEKTMFRRPKEGSRGLIRATEISLARSQVSPLSWTPPLISSTIAKSKDQVLAIAGEPDLAIPYYAAGPQFSFRGFAQSGYLLELMFYGNVVVYVANGIVSGISVYATNAYRFDIASQATGPRGTPLMPENAEGA